MSDWNLQKTPKGIFHADKISRDVDKDLERDVNVRTEWERFDPLTPDRSRKGPHRPRSPKPVRVRDDNVWRKFWTGKPVGGVSGTL